MQEVTAGVADAGMDTLDLAFFHLLLNLGLAAHRLLRHAQRGSVPPEATSGALNVPFERVGHRATPMSIPTASPLGADCSTSRSVWIDTHPLPHDTITVTFLNVPSAARLLR